MPFLAISSAGQSDRSSSNGIGSVPAMLFLGGCVLRLFFYSLWIVVALFINNLVTVANLWISTLLLQNSFSGNQNGNLSENCHFSYFYFSPNPRI